MKRMLYLTVVFFGLLRSTPAQTIPKEMWGRWVVRREVPTTTISCWGEEKAKTLIGTEIEYSAGFFRWQKVVTKNPTAEITTVGADQFHDENSGKGTNSSQVTFEQLGIKADKVTQIVIQHPAANISGGTVEIPGDSVLIKGKNTIVFSVCNLYFEAERVGAADAPLRVQTGQTEEQDPEPLEIRLTKSPRWENGGLSVSLDRINHSSLPLFLPVMGLYIYTSVSEVGEDGRRTGGQEWINVYGVSDLVSWGATSIAPGATVHDEHGLGSRVAIVNLDRQTRREIPLRGRLRIDAYYFSTEKDWQKNKSQHEDRLRTPPNQWDRLGHQGPEVVTVFAEIPCREGDCASSCDNPPPILHGENRVVPDVMDFEPEWKARGKAIGEELDRRFPACPGPRPTPR